MQNRVTQAEVARAAGVHRTTVSLALRNHPSIPRDTCTRIQRLAEDLGYCPDPALQALMAYRTHKSQSGWKTVAYITNFPTRFGWQTEVAHQQFFAGASRRAMTLGYSIEHFWLSEPGISHERLSDILGNRGITGIILASHRVASRDPVDMVWNRFSAVKIDYSPSDLGLHKVTNDQGGSMRMACQRLLDLGYKRIGFVLPRCWDEYVDYAWSAGFSSVQIRLPAADQVPILFYDVPNPEKQPTSSSDYAVTREDLSPWYSTYRPQVIVSHGPFVFRTMQAIGIRIPEDVHYCDISVGDSTTAGIRQSSERVGEVAIELLASQLQQNTRGIPFPALATFVAGSWQNGPTLPPSEVRKPQSVLTKR